MAAIKSFKRMTHEGSEESRLGVELLCGVADASSQDSPQHIAASGVVWSPAIAQGNGQGSNVVGNNPKIFQNNLII